MGTGVVKGEINLVTVAAGDRYDLSSSRRR